jgi:curved DNA-binding protein CbpA
MAAASPFQVLGISPDAEPEVILAAYRALARKYHPDVNPGVPPEQLNARMKQINWAKAELEHDRAGWRMRVRRSEARASGAGSRASGDEPRRESTNRAQSRSRATYTIPRKRRSTTEAILLSLLRPLARTGFRF